MARQAGPIYLIGTIDDITFYKMEGEYFARKKSSLDRRQFRTDPRFARSRQAAHTFGEASQLASAIYWQLPKAQRGKGVVNRLTGQVGALLRKGHTPEEVKIILLQQMGIVSCTSQQPEPAIAPPVKKQVPTVLSGWHITPKGKLFKTLVDSSLLTCPESYSKVLTTHLPGRQRE